MGKREEINFRRHGACRVCTGPSFWKSGRTDSELTAERLAALAGRLSQPAKFGGIGDSRTVSARPSSCRRCIW